MEVSQWAKIFLILGIVLFIIGVFLYFLPRIPWLGRLGRLPGDLVWKRNNVTIYIPIVTSLLISAVFSAVIILISYLRR